VIPHRAQPASTTVAPPAAAAAHPGNGGTGADVTGSGAAKGPGGLGLSGLGPVPAGSVAYPPRILKRVTPAYPIQARVRGVAGRVVVEVVLGREGQIRRVTVVHSVPPLDQAAIRAVRQWRFSPARDASGAPVSVIVDIPVVFTLDD
jgi:protein TonB